MHLNNFPNGKLDSCMEQKKDGQCSVHVSETLAGLPSALVGEIPLEVVDRLLVDDEPQLRVDGIPLKAGE